VALAHRRHRTALAYAFISAPRALIKASRLNQWMIAVVNYHQLKVE
jgi:hypothetical protein